MGIISWLFLWRVRGLVRKAIKECRLTFKSENNILYVDPKGTTIHCNYSQMANVILDATNYKEFIEEYLKVNNTDVVKVLKEEYEKQKGRAK
jgi:hypothetical protein